MLELLVGCGEEEQTAKIQKFQEAWTPEEGGDHAGAEWAPEDGSEIAGYHYNIGTFSVPVSTTVYIKAFDGTNYGGVRIQSENVNIEGTVDGSGRGGLGGEPGGGS